MRLARLCFRLLLILGAGITAFFISVAVFDFAAISLLHKDTEPLRFALLEGNVGFPFAALSALLSAYCVFRILESRMSAGRLGQ